MSYALYVTHPQVVPDPKVPVTRWGLSQKGRERAERFANHSLIRRAKRIVTSPDTKAIELATILSGPSGTAVESGENFAENDRRSTGFVSAERFEELFAALYASPATSPDGWESAYDTQERIVAAYDAALVGHDPAHPIIFTGHGTVGTLLKCHLGNRAIARCEDQRVIADPGGGNVFVVRLSDRRLLSDWMAMEALPEDFPV
ncbi:MAG: histidine phosphatase family protein [Alphaproteobacteria bacterium]|nr:MAG: histidine phosphatase family protein [Alphaproteobacteria bacterium]